MLLYIGGFRRDPMRKFAAIAIGDAKGRHIRSRLAGRTLLLFEGFYLFFRFETLY